MVRFLASGKWLSKILYWIVVAGLFTLAAWQRFSLPLDPIADPDTWGYLSPALEKLTGGAFIHNGRNFLYPGFLFLLLRLFGDFRAITIAQHLLGLGAGGLLLLTWQRTRVFVSEMRRTAGLHRLLGLAAAAICLTAGGPINTEMQIRAEGISAFLLGLNIYCTIEFIARAFIIKRPAVAFGIFAGITAGALASIKPSFALMAVLALGPLTVFVYRAREWRKRFALVGGVVFGGIVLFLSDYLLGRSDDVAASFLPTTLFVVHADLIRDQMADELRGEADLPYKREWLTSVHEKLAAEITRSAAAEPWHYHSLGFSPDYLMSNETSINANLGEYFGEDTGAFWKFYRSYYWRTWRGRPAAMLRKIGGQMALFYSSRCPAYDRSKIISLSDSYRLTGPSLHLPAYQSVWRNYPPAVEFLVRAESLAQRTVTIEQPRLLRGMLTYLADVYRPLLLTSIALGLLALFSRGYRARFGWLASLTLFLFAYNAAACLEVAIVNSLDVWRYCTVQFYFTLLAEVLAIWLALETLVHWIRWGRPIQTSTPGE